MRDTDKSRYFAVTVSSSIIVYHSVTEFRLFLMNICHFESDRKKEKTMSRSLFVGSYLQVKWWAFGQWKGKIKGSLWLHVDIALVWAGTPSCTLIRHTIKKLWGKAHRSLRSEDVFPVVAALCLRRERSDDLKYVCALQAGAHRRRITNVFIQQFSSYFKAVGPKRFHFLFKILLPSRCIAKSIFSGF